MRTTCFMALLVLIFVGCKKGEIGIDPPAPTPGIVDQVEMGSDYGLQIFYSLETGSVVSQNAKTDWDLAFQTEDTGFAIALNSSKLMAAWNTGEKDLGNVTSLSSAVWDWDSPKGHWNSTVLFNWQDSNWVYTIDRGYDTEANHLGYKKFQALWVNDSQYFVKYANIDGTDADSAILQKDTAYNAGFFHFGDGQVLIQPKKRQWDLQFSVYTHVFAGPLAYTVNGVLCNRSFTGLAADSSLSYSEISTTDTSTMNFVDDLDRIGYGWKDYDFGQALFVVKPQLKYVFRSGKGRTYKIRFLDFYTSSGVKGAPKFEFEEI